MSNPPETSVGFTKTSENYPITNHVSVVLTHPSNGAVISCCICPGKWEKSGSMSRDLDKDLAVLKNAGYSVIVCFIDDYEMKKFRLGSPRPPEDSSTHVFARAYRTAVTRAGFTLLTMPIVDFGAPPSLERAHSLARRIWAEANAGCSVLLHCRGGVGRSGTIAACCALISGSPDRPRSGAEALRFVRARRRGAVESKAQEQFVHDFAQTYGQPCTETKGDASDLVAFESSSGGM